MAAVHPTKNRPRLLVISFACGPYFGSEAGAGWHRVVEEAKYFDTWVICEGRCAADIQRYERENGPIEGLRFVYVDMPAWESLFPLLAIVRYMRYYAYTHWHYRALRRARQLHAEVKFDVAHQATLVGYREPGFLWKLGIPFVWGPIGGTQNYPWRFLLMEKEITATANELFRTVANWIQLRTSRRVRRAARAASPLLAANTTTANDFAKVHGVKSVLLSDVGTQRAPSEPRAAEEGRPLRLLWSGILEPRKALPVLLEALAHVKGEVDFELRVLGTGPHEKHWRRRATRLGLDAHVSWLGFLPHDQAIEQYRWADIFAFTSLRDTTGWVVIEALTAGVPVVTFDHQGAGDVVTTDCGVKIPVGTPRQAFDDWATAIRRLAASPKLRERLSRGACQRASEYLWSKNGRRTAEILFRALGVDSPDTITANGSLSDDPSQTTFENLDCGRSQSADDRREMPLTDVSC